MFCRAAENGKTKTLKAQITDVINGLGIVRCEEKKVNWNDETYGHTIVWYDVCFDEGNGDIIDSFKLKKLAIHFAENYEG